MLTDLINAKPGEHRLFLKGDMGDIEAILHLPEKVLNSVSSKPEAVPKAAPKAVMICCHPHPLFAGTMTNKIVHTICKTFSRMGVPSLRFNFRGVGKSDGTHDEGRGEVEDLLSLCQQMKDCWPESELWLSGFSFGSWIAVHAAAKAGAKQLLSIAPPISHFDFNSFVKPNCDWLVVMGEDDEVVEPELVYSWIDAQQPKPQLVRFPETGHFFHGKIVKLSELLIKHYSSLLKVTY